jgi:hypothetical protein
MRPSVIGVPWFTPETFERVRLISDDNLLDTFTKWEERAERNFEQLLATGLNLERVLIDPDALLAFARERHGGKINDIIRHDFAAMRTAKKHGNDQDGPQNSN